jgi:protein-glucosylgalactosylhydroxylysine glucosidase
MEMEMAAQMNFNAQPTLGLRTPKPSRVVPPNRHRNSLRPNARRAGSCLIVEGGSSPQPTPKKPSWLKRFAFASLASLLSFTSLTSLGAPIDRHALVTRHNVVLHQFDVNNPLTVGNGEFAFTVDATGLQTFGDAFEHTIPLGTLSDWGWHTAPNPNNWSIDTFQFKLYTNFNGRPVPYADVPHNQQTPEIKWLRSNPHRLDLGQIGFVLKKSDGTLAQTNDLTDITQTLDLWNGEIISHFKFDGQPVDVETICAPDTDTIAVHVTSSLVKSQRLSIQIHFPYGTGDTTTADWSHPDAHTTTLTRVQPNNAIFTRKLDKDSYFVGATWTEGATLTKTANHQFEIVTDKRSDTLEFVCAFRPITHYVGKLPDFAQVKQEASNHWTNFWQTGGAIDLSGSKDPRWFELERRIVLSQYLTAIQDAGDYPPQETGLTYNTWEGKFHLEMHFWHEAHFALWDRLPLLERSLDYYNKILPRAEGTAKKQGYTGARWPKMTSPSGAESPSPVGPFLVWQEPHPIFYAELCYRQHNDKATLEKFKDVVFQTADFMASYPAWDTNTHRYVLGPILQCAQEIFPKDKTFNPTFELTYWRWALETAQTWRTRLGLPRDAKWDAVLHDLAKPPVVDNKYAFTETTPDSYTNPKWNKDHPAVVGALSWIPGPGIDPVTMKNSFDWIWKNWNWPDTWGWDYPMLAMTAARLGDGERAVDALLLDTPKNHYALNGHVYQRPGLTLYLPANGGLLYATALMAAGWDNAPKRNAPGFPDNGQWTVRWENLKVAP